MRKDTNKEIEERKNILSSIISVISELANYVVDLVLFNKKKNNSDELE